MKETQSDSGAASSLISKVVQKVRKCISSEQFGYKQMYNHPLHRQFKPLFTKLQEHFVAATLYHAGKVDMCEKLLAMGDEQVTSIKDALKESLPATLT